MKLIRQPAAKRRMLILAGATVGTVRLVLFLLPFETFSRFLIVERNSASKLHHGDDAIVREITQSVRTVSRYVPRATCLTQAVATVLLLRQFGHAASLRIGVSKSGEGKIKAHAWVVNQGQTVIGDLTELAQYTVLLR